MKAQRCSSWDGIPWSGCLHWPLCSLQSRCVILAVVEHPREIVSPLCVHLTVAITPFPFTGWLPSTGSPHWVTSLGLHSCITKVSGSWVFECPCIYEFKFCLHSIVLAFRSTITVFPNRVKPYCDFRVWNVQLISYAGYKNSDGTILGDPSKVEFTEVGVF